jgi:hypothetical protein
MAQVGRVFILRESRRYWRSNRLGAVLVGLMLAVGFSGAALTLAVMLALSSPAGAGLNPMRYLTIAEETSGGGSRPISWTSYEQLRGSITSRNSALLAYAEPTRARTKVDQSTLDISVAGVSEGFFSKAVAGFIGDDFSPSWEGDNGEGEVILGASLQQKFFSSPAYALGRSITMNGQSYRIVGIAPKAFTGLWYTTDAWVTPDRFFALSFGLPKDQLATAAATTQGKMWKSTPVFYALACSAQLSKGGMRRELDAQMRFRDNSLNHLHVTDGLSNDPIRDQKILSWSRLAFLLSLALIFAASFNYCGLLIAQAPRRIAELRLKRVLGASVIRIITENFCGPGLIVAIGFLLACAMSVAGVWVLNAQAGGYLAAVNITWLTLSAVLGLELVLAFLLAAFVTLIPSFRLMDDSGIPRLGYTSTVSKRSVFALQGIVAMQIAFCILIGLGTTMIFGAVRSMSRESLGFYSDQLTVVPVTLASATGNMDFRISSTHDFPMAIFTRQTLQHAAEALPSVRAMAAASCAPFGKPMKTMMIRPMDSGSLPPHTAHFCGVTQGFFETMGTPMIQGRGFSSGSLTGAVSEVVINRKLAQELWPGKNPLHRVLQLQQPELGFQFVTEVVGVTEDMRLAGRTSTPDAALFLPLRSEVFAFSVPLYFVVKGSESPHTLEMLTNQQATLFMSSLATDGAYRISEKLRSSSFEQAMRVYVTGGGTLLIALIAYTGLYGVLVYFINTRRREIALRMCFGASRWDVRRNVIQQAAQCALFAVLASLLGWGGIARLAASEWTGQNAWSWEKIVIIPIACVTASILISLVPANAAARVSPGEILKEQ